MESVACPVHTVGCGLVASMASVILACGDHRSLYARSHMLIHQLLSGVGMAQQSDIGIVAEQASALRDSLDELLAEHSSMDRATVHAITERDCWLTAPRALELGLIDEVIDPVEKNLAAPAR